MTLVFVGLGGAAGAICRYLMGLLPIPNPNGFPLTTMIINVIGAFVIGILAVRVGKTDWLSPNMMSFLKIGLCGGFTTFSTFSLELFNLLDSGKCFTGILYGILSVIFCVLAVAFAHLVFS